MKIYVASSWRNEQQPAVVARLRAENHEVYDFRNPDPEIPGFSWRWCAAEPPPWSADGTRVVLQHPVAQRGFDLDFAAMKWADAIVMAQPCGRSAALELGWGAGAGKITVALLADGQEPELMVKMADYIAVSLDEACRFLGQRVAVLNATTPARDTAAMAGVPNESLQEFECSYIGRCNSSRCPKHGNGAP